MRRGHYGLQALLYTVALHRYLRWRLRGVPYLEGSDPVFPEDLDGAEAAQRVRVEPGDILFVRTGFPDAGGDPQTRRSIW